MPSGSEIPKTPDVHEEPKNGLVHEALYSAAYAALQQPVTGLSQIVDNIAGTEIQTQTLFMEAPIEAKFGSSQWHAQTIGSAAGGLLPLLAVGKFVKTQMAGAAEAEGGLLSRRAAIGLSLKESAATGFINDALFRPTAQGGNFWADRLSNGVSGALTFSAMTATSLGLAGASQTGFAKALSLGKAMRNPVVSGLISGVPGGAVSAEYDALVNHRRLATGQELGHSVYSMSLIGGGFGLQHHVFGGKVKSNQEIVLGVSESKSETKTGDTANAANAGNLGTVGDAQGTEFIGKPKPKENVLALNLGVGADSNTVIGRDSMAALMEALSKHKDEPFSFLKGDLLHEPMPRFEIDRRDYFPRERFETETERAAKDLKYAVAKTLLSGLEQTQGAQSAEVANVLEGTKAPDAVQPTEAMSSAKPASAATGELQISLIEAQAIHDLKARNESDAHRLVKILSERGPLEARVANQILRSSYCEFFPLSETELKTQFAQAQQYLQAVDVLRQAETGVIVQDPVAPPNEPAQPVATIEAARTAAENGETGTVVEAPAVVEAKSPITVTEAKAFRTLQAQQSYEQHKLSEIFEKRGPVAKWVCEQMAKDYREFLSGGGMPEGGGVGLKMFITKTNIKEVKINQAYLNDLTERGQRFVEAEKVLSDMYRVRPEERRFDAKAPLNKSEANALAAFAREGSRYQVQSLADMIGARGREAQYICSKIAGHMLRRPTDVIILEHGRRGIGYPTTVTAEWLAETTHKAHEYVGALDVVANVEKTRQTPYVGKADKAPITVEEANAIRILRNESQEQSLHLIHLLGERGAAAEFIGRRLNKVSSEPITQQAIDAHFAESGPYVEARNVLAAVEQGKTVGTKSGFPITLQEAKAIATLGNEPGDMDARLISALAVRGPCAEFVAQRIKSDRYGRQYSDAGPIDEAALAKLTKIGERVEIAQQILDQAIAAKELEAATAGNAKGTKSEGAKEEGGGKKDGGEPLTVEEADAVATLTRFKSMQDGMKLAELAGARSEKAKWVADYITGHQHVFENGVNAETLGHLNTAYEIQKVMDTNPAAVKEYRLFAYRLASETGISGAEEATPFLNLITRMDPPHDQRRWDQNPRLPIVKEMASWNSIAALPEWSLGAAHDHVKITGQTYKSHSAQQITLAAQAWQAEPTLPYALAMEIGALPAQKRLAAGVAWRETLAANGIENPAEFGNKPIDAELDAAFRERFAQVSGEGRAAIIGRLGTSQWRSLPVAIEALHGGMSTEAKQGLHRAVLESATEPFKVLTGLKSGHFEAAYNKLVGGLSVEAAGTSRGHDYAASTALKLALTFRGGWDNWLQVQKRVGRTDHDATYWLPIVPAAELNGLGQTLLNNANRNITQLELLTRRWSEVPEQKRVAPFKDIMEHLLTNKYENVTDKDFAVEAGAWGMAPRHYKERETRYLASQTVPVPFPIDMVWQSGELRGRFIPRNDTRGLFLGQHTNSCQHPDGAASSSAWYGQESPKSGFFVVENKHGEVVAESWAWIADNDGVAFDNVEAKGIGTRAEDVKKVYQQAANELAKKHHVVTLGTGHGDLDLTGWNEAGDKTLKLPSDYSGYTDAHKQVVLAQNTELKPSEVKKDVTVRGALNSDMEALQRISRARYPEGWQEVPIDADTRGLVIEEPDKGVIGYALIEPSNRYISDIAVMPDANVQKTLSLIKSVSELIKQTGGEWSADCRDGTSYRLLKTMEKRGKIKILKDNVTNKMGNEDMHHVVFVAIK